VLLSLARNVVLHPARHELNVPLSRATIYLVADDGEHVVDASLLVLGEYRQDAAERTCRRPGDVLGGLLVELRHVEGVLEHIAELAVVDSTVRAAVEADHSLGLVAADVCLLADSQRQRRQELTLRHSTTAQPVIVLEELRRPDARPVDGNLSPAFHFGGYKFNQL